MRHTGSPDWDAPPNPYFQQKPTNGKLKIRIILAIPIFEFALAHKNSSGWHYELAKKLKKTLTIKSKEEGPPDEQECVNYENNTNTIIAEKDIPPVYWVHHDEFAELRTRPKKKVE
jgi:hypothetical protein